MAIATVTFLVGLTDWIPLANCQTAWFVKKPCSCSYSYSRHNVKCRPFVPILQTLVDIVERILYEKGFNAININNYTNEKSALGYHSDGESLFQAKIRDSCIVSISFGATRRFAIRNLQCGAEKITPLQHGDICTMEGLFQKFYEHSILRESCCTGRWFNLTLRKIVQHQTSCSMSTS